MISHRRLAAVMVAVVAALALLVMHGGLDAHATVDHHRPGAHDHASASPGAVPVPAEPAPAQPVSDAPGHESGHDPGTGLSLHLASVCAVAVAGALLWLLSRARPRFTISLRPSVVGWLPLRDSAQGPARYLPRSSLCVELC